MAGAPAAGGPLTLAALGALALAACAPCGGPPRPPEGKDARPAAHLAGDEEMRALLGEHALRAVLRVRIACFQGIVVMHMRLALRLIVAPTLEYLAEFGVRDGPSARAMVGAIGWQESRLEHRDQLDPLRRNGPALGLWQFEKAGGTAEVLSNVRTASIARRVLADMMVNGVDVPDVHRVWEALEYSDHLACAFARLLLWPDPEPLPPAEDAPAARDAAWRYYLRRWKPGKPHPETWATAWAVAVAAAGAEAAP